MTTSVQLRVFTAYSMVSYTLYTMVEPQKFMKDIGSFEKRSAYSPNLSMCLSSLILLNWQSIEVMRISVRTSKLPQSTEWPCSHRSRDNCERKVVLPQPVGPDTIVNSPLRSPLIVLLKKGSQPSPRLTPQYFVWFCTLSLILSLKALNWTRVECSEKAGCEDSSSWVIIYGFFSKKSLASLQSGSLCLTTLVLSLLSLLTRDSVLPLPVESLSIHRIMRLKRLSQGRNSSPKLVAPLGREMAALPVA